MAYWDLYNEKRVLLYRRRERREVKEELGLRSKKSCIVWLEK